MKAPVSQKTFYSLCQKWAKAFEEKQNMLDIWFPISGANMRIKQFLADGKQQQEVFVGKIPKLLLVDFGDSQTVLASDLAERIALDLPTESSFETYLSKNVNPLLIFLLGTDESLNNKNYEIFPYIEKVTIEYPHVRFILVTENGTKDILPFLTNFSLTCQPLYSLEDSLQFYTYLEEKWNFSMPKTFSTLLFGYLGGHFLLLKEAARLIKANQKITIEEILKSLSIQEKAQAIFEKLSLEDQIIIQSFLNKQKIPPSDYLEKTGILTKQHLGIPYWERIKTDLLVPKSLSLDMLLTSQEREVFELLEEHTNVVHRDAIAKTLWPEKWEETYSDWAMDKMMQRIREKIEKTHAPFQLLTKKGEGFVLLKTIDS